MSILILFRAGEQIDLLVVDENYDFEYQEMLNLGKTKTVKLVSAVKFTGISSIHIKYMHCTIQNDTFVYHNSIYFLNTVICNK